MDGTVFLPRPAPVALPAHPQTCGLPVPALVAASGERASVRFLEYAATVGRGFCMHRRTLLHAIGGLATLPTLGACVRVAPLENVQDAAFVGEASLPRRTEQIKRAGASLGWVMEQQQPGLMRGTLNLRTHQAVVDVPYDARRFSIRYVSSTDLDYSGGAAQHGNPMIHRNYNSWIENLEHKISAESAI